MTSTRRRSPRVGAALLILGAFGGLLLGCRYPDRNVRSEPSVAWAAPEETRLGRESRADLAQHSELTGVYRLGHGLDAFAARALLCTLAERALDVQYYILHDDVTGRFLLGQLLAAADRGVRVRLLLDDVGTAGLDGLLAALDAHPHIEVRLFNPFARGWPRGLVRALDGLRRLRQLNHRMHNKMLAADGAAAIVGGRNLGDEYFDADAEINFADLDLLVFGPVLSDLGSCFDRYWNCPYAVPVGAWDALRASERELDSLREELAAHATAQQDSTYARRVKSSNLVEDVLSGALPLQWARVQAVADAPEKVVARGDELERALLTRQIREPVARAETDLAIVSPYFVPGRAGVEFLVELRRRGVRVRVLTNAFAATDVPAVHAGYSGYRRELLAAGVELYELRPTSDTLQEAHAEGLLGSSGASLHAKTFVVDGRGVFVGSLNLDPRSIELNTELGLVVESEEIAALLLAGFERAIRPDLSWHVRLDGPDDDARMVWDGEQDGALQRSTSEPDLGFWSGLWLGFLRWLPVEGQL